METTASEKDTQTTYPLLADRIQSTFIDTVFLIVLMFLISSILDKYENVPDWLRIVLFIGLWVAYEPVSTSLGCTLGNYIKNIRVRRYNNTAKSINVFQGIIRYITKIALGWISFLTIHSNTQKRAIHDFVSGSVMIKLPTNK